MTYPRYFNARIETMPLKQIQELQERKLRKQLTYNYQNSAFYRHKFDEVGAQPEDIRTLEDLAKLPFTTKEELRVSKSSTRRRESLCRLTGRKYRVKWSSHISTASAFRLCASARATVW